MNLAILKKRLGKSATKNVEVLVRYVDTLGSSQTVPIARVIEEIDHNDDNSDRRVILIVE